jgi:peptidoglycan hydrolase CwlO-like protein
MLGVAGGLLLGAQTAVGSPLDSEACTRLKDEEAQLVKAGAKSNMERGPVWAKANLAPEKLKEIEHYIELQEQILFRCPQPKPSPQEAGEKGEQAAAAAPKGRRPLTKAAAIEHAPSASTAKTKAASQAPAIKAAAEGATSARGKKAPARPKPNDAYIPPVKPDAE